MGQGDIIRILEKHKELTTKDIAHDLGKSISSTQVNLRALRKQKVIKMNKIKNKITYSIL